MAIQSTILAWRIPWTEEPGESHGQGSLENPMGIFSPVLSPFLSILWSPSLALPYSVHFLPFSHLLLFLLGVIWDSP